MKPKRKDKTQIKRLISYVSLGLGIACLLGLHLYVSGQFDKKPRTISFTVFKKDANAGELEREGTIDGFIIKGKYKNGEEFNSYYGVNDKDVQNFLDSNADKIDYKFVYEKKTDWSEITKVLLILALIIFGLLLFIKLMNRVQRSSVAGKTRMVAYKEEKHGKITFNDVAGVDEAKEDVADIADFLKDPESFTRLGARSPGGVLLVGPPGTGKTLLARALAAETGVSFFFISGSDFVEMFVGVGASRIREVFEKARNNSPCIIFIDEFDAVAKKRGAITFQSHSESDQTLNQLLVEMDGFERNKGIVIMAATNRPDVLDPALLRPGRFDRKVFVGRADVYGREKILFIHTKNKKLAKDVDLKKTAALAHKFSGADLEGLTNEAAIIAARKKKEAIEQADFDEALDKVFMGKKLSRKIVKHERKILAYHEIGHLIVGIMALDKEDVYKVTIEPRQDGALGFAAFFEGEERYMKSKQDLESAILTLLGGRAAEEIIFGDGDVTTGAANDLKRATELQIKIISFFGMDEEFGLAVFEDNGSGSFKDDFLSASEGISQETRALKDKLVRVRLAAAYKRTKDILLENKDDLEHLAAALLEHETLDREQIKKILGN